MHRMFSLGQHMEDASHHLDASALNFGCCWGEREEDQTVFCDVFGATASTDLHTVNPNLPLKLRGETR